MDGYDLTMYRRAEEIIEELGMAFGSKGTQIWLEDSMKQSLGCFENVRELYMYVCGYREGLNIGRAGIGRLSSESVCEDKEMSYVHGMLSENPKYFV